MIEIRPAALSEFALLPFLEAEADAAFDSLKPAIDSGSFPPPGTAEEYAEAFHIMVAGRPPLGFVRLEIVDGQAHLQQMAVGGRYARRGIGRALLLAAKAWAHEAGFQRMTLTTFTAVPFNAPFYANYGFSELAQDAWGSDLAEIRRQEQERGLDQLGPRMAMVAVLDGAGHPGVERVRRGNQAQPGRNQPGHYQPGHCQPGTHSI